MPMETKQVDIIILSGFLGSGKSTLLQDLIAYEKDRGRKIGVLMNELGEISIDSAIVPSDTPLKEMLNGCICCTIQGELSLQLSVLLDEHELDVIFIEATGAAHPLEVIDACTHPTLASRVRLASVVTIVSAIQWVQNKLSIKLKKLLAEQVKYADIVLINKKDQVNEQELQSVREDVSSINSRALISTVAFAKMNHADIYERPMDEESKVRGHHESHVNQHLHLRTASFPVPKPVDRIALSQWLENKNQLYRAKGFIYLTETPGLFLFNFSFGGCVFERYRTDKTYTPVLVFIGENLDRESIQQELKQFQN